MVQMIITQIVQSIEGKEVSTADLSLFSDRRCSLEVIRDILTVALDSANCTRIVYKANLTFPRFKRYSACLVAKGLLTFDGGSSTNCRGIYKTTEKGEKLLQLLAEISKLV